MSRFVSYCPELSLNVAFLIKYLYELFGGTMEFSYLYDVKSHHKGHGVSTEFHLFFHPEVNIKLRGTLFPPLSAAPTFVPEAGGGSHRKALGEP